MRTLKAFLLIPFPVLLLVLSASTYGLLTSDDLGPSDIRSTRSQLALISFYGTLYTYLIALAFALPILVILRKIGWANWATAILTGAFLGSLVILGPELFDILFDERNTTSQVTLGDCKAVIDGVRTRCGYFHSLRASMPFAIFGAFSGGFFWLAYVFANAIGLRIIVGMGIGLVAWSVGLIAYTTDRTCHNKARSGKTSFSPWLALDIEVSTSDWPMLIKSVQAFATDNNASFRDESLVQAVGSNRLYFSLCNDDGFYVSVLEDEWKIDSPGVDSVGYEVTLLFYEVVDDQFDIPMARSLAAKLNENWPNRVSFDWRKEGLDFSGARE